MEPTMLKSSEWKPYVYLSTVSRALSGHPDIRVERQLRVETLARELEYQPNTLTESSRHKRTQVIDALPTRRVARLLNSVSIATHSCKHFARLKRYVPDGLADRAEIHILKICNPFILI
jgi:hypothetical protein